MLRNDARASPGQCVAEPSAGHGLSILRDDAAGLRPSLPRAHRWRCARSRIVVTPPPAPRSQPPTRPPLALRPPSNAVAAPVGRCPWLPSRPARAAEAATKGLIEEAGSWTM